VRCDQIGPYLSDFAAGTLPAYKGAWVSQHLGGCSECSARLQAHRSPPAKGPPAAVVGQAVPQVLPMPRTPPRWYRWAVLGLLALAAAGSVWLLTRTSVSPDRPVMIRPVPETADWPKVSTPDSRPFSAPPDTHGMVSLHVEQVEADDEYLRARIRFEGGYAVPPKEMTDWVMVTDAQGRILESSVPYVAFDPKGISAAIEFRPREGERRFELQFSGVGRLSMAPWHLSLPFPDEPSERHARDGLMGFPYGVRLLHYETTDDLLRVDLEMPQADGWSMPVLYLRDDTGHEYAPISETREPPTAARSASFTYAVPSVLRYPLELVGEGEVCTYLGPWTINLTVLP